MSVKNREKRREYQRKYQLKCQTTMLGEIAGMRWALREETTDRKLEAVLPKLAAILAEFDEQPVGA